MLLKHMVQRAFGVFISMKTRDIEFNGLTFIIFCSGSDSFIHPSVIPLHGRQLWFHFNLLLMWCLISPQDFIMTCVNRSIRIFVQHVFYIFNFYFIYVNSKLNCLWLIFNFKTSSNGQVNPNNKKGHKGKHKHSRFASFQKTRQRREGQSDIVTTWAGHRS